MFRWLFVRFASEGFRSLHKNFEQLHSRAGSEATTQRRAELRTTQTSVVAGWRVPVGFRGSATHQEFNGHGITAAIVSYGLTAVGL